MHAAIRSWIAALTLLVSAPALAQPAQAEDEASAEPEVAQPEVTQPEETEPAPSPPSEVGDASAERGAPRPAAELEGPNPAPNVRLEWGRGLSVRSDDGAFTLEIRSRVQAQAAFESAGPGEAEPDIQFLIRRARVAFRGHLGSSDLQYYVQLGFAPLDMESDLLIPLRDAQIAWLAHRDLAIRVGQMKVPFSRERVISSSALQLVDRSIVNRELNLDRDIGIQLYSTDLFGLGDVLAYQLGVFGGEGRLRFNEGSGLLYVARLEVQPFGRFDDDYVEVDLSREERVRLSIGLGFAWNQASRRTRSTHGGVHRLEGGFDYASFEADLIFKYAGFSLMAEVIYREATGVQERSGELEGVPVTERARNGVGWFVQAGYLFSREVPIELAARFADIHPIGALTALGPEREMTLGLGYYPIGHDLKIQLDYSHLSFDRLEDGHHRIRLQTQAFF